MRLLWFKLNNRTSTNKTLRKTNEDVEIKGPHFYGLVTTNVLNTKIGEVENKSPDVTDLVKKTDYYTKRLRENTSLRLIIISSCAT